MNLTHRASRPLARLLRFARVVSVTASVSTSIAIGQDTPNSDVRERTQLATRTVVSGTADEGATNTFPSPPFNSAVNAALAPYFDSQQGAASYDLIRRALETNGELVAARQEATRARARLRQSGLRPNPTIDFEHTTGALTGSRGESETSIGVALPLEIGGRRRSRIALAQAELEAIDADIANRERLLSGDIRTLYAEALTALRELETTAGLTDLDLQIVRVVQIRVNEGDTPPLELNLLRVEVDRLRSRRALVEGRLRGTLIRLKAAIGIAPEESLRVREELAAPIFTLPLSLEAATEIALRTRPDLRLARLNEEVARAGFRLARANAAPDVTTFTRYTQSRSSFDDTPVGVLRDSDRTLTFGATIGIPVFNKGQGAQAEAQIAIEQARTRREFAESIVRAETAAGYARLEAARAAVSSFESGVLARSNDNIRVIRAAYDLGEYRVTDLINEQRRLVESNREFTEALAEQYRALADLQAAIGAPIEPQQQP